MADTDNNRDRKTWMNNFEKRAVIGTQTISVSVARNLKDLGAYAFKVKDADEYLLITYRDSNNPGRVAGQFLDFFEINEWYETGDPSLMWDLQMSTQGGRDYEFHFKARLKVNEI